MKIRRFYSKNMRSALRQVTEAFGQDAAILSNKKTATGVEVIAALDYDEDLLPSTKEQIPSTYGDDITTNFEPTKEEAGARLDVSKDVDGRSLEDETFNHYRGPLDSHVIAEKRKGDSNEYAITADAIKSLSSRQNSKLSYTDIAETHQTAHAEPSPRQQVEWSTDPGLVAMKEELGLMRSMMAEQLNGIGWERFTEKEPIKAMLTRRSASLGINQSITSQLIPKVKKGQDVECSWQNLLALIAKSVNINCQNILTEGGVFAFMGPTGAGKTTSIAKIAARFVIKHGVDSVALISTDTYRISAQQQLQNFAKLIGIPMATVTSKRSINQLLERFSNKKLVLIDTAGMSKNDLAIAKQLDTLNYAGNNIKKFLMMPATNQLAVLRQSVKLFQPYAPYSVIITKLDEAASLGEVLSLVIENNLPVALTTDGQRVPEDIRLARNHHLVSKAVWLTNKFGTNPEDWQLAQEQRQLNYA